jgi:hypothetical protein
MNPYSFVDPVVAADMFYGYQDELEEIVAKVSKQGSGRLSFFVVGARRMGKTSLLLQIERRLRLLNTEEPDSHHPILIPLYLDTLRLGEASLRGFFGLTALMLARYIVSNLSHLDISNSIIVDLEAVKTANDPLGAFQDCLLQLTRGFEPQRLRIVLLIDELGRVVRQMTGEALKSNLRSLHINPWLQYSLAYVIAGSHDELDSVRPAGSPLENILVLRRLHVFDEKQALALIQEPIKSQLAPEVAEQIYLESGGHPFLLQYIMYTLCEKGSLGNLRVEDVYQTTKRFLNERRDFDSWWEMLGEVDRKVYEAFGGRSRRNSVSDLTRMMLSVPSQSGDARRVVIDRSMVTKALDVLGTTGLVRQVADSTWERAGELFARWARNQFTLL